MAESLLRSESLLRYVDLGCGRLLIRGFLPLQDTVDYLLVLVRMVLAGASPVAVSVKVLAL